MPQPTSSPCHAPPLPPATPSPGSTDVPILAQQQLSERVLEGCIAERVACRVDGAVDVAQPVADGPQIGGDAGRAESVDQHHHVVGRPCGHKRHQDGHDGASHLLLPGRCPPLLNLPVRPLIRYLKEESSVNFNFINNIKCRSVLYLTPKLAFLYNSCLYLPCSS